ncbi:thioredoxin family protein [Gemmata sp. G18]|uniref:Thioredoxin family protein n=1 Tax=Gemmata palustris TaxID=2822762 RepID=A0ABS5BLR3_9BACT|nr:thioredoxin family protein [Gemmata palustris]MBP3954654.1 thioredoxin family protein [Gemmata palustris]
MNSPASRLCALFPLVTAAALWHAHPAVAQPARPAAPAQVAWRTDYNTARKEAQDKGLPLLVVVGTEDCFYCRKLEAGPLKDPALTPLLASGFVPLKLDARNAPELAKALKVQMYPTTVLAGPDGKIHAFIEGYIETERLAEQMKRTVTAVTTTDWAARDFNEASKALAVSDYPRAVSLLKGISKDAGDKPVGVKAKQILGDVEKVAAGKLAQAKQLEQRGQTQDAMDALADAVRTYAGTQAASDAAATLAGLTDRPEVLQQRRLRVARDMLAVARDDFRAGRLYDCMQKCEQVASAYSELPEAKDATALLTDIRGNPERLAKACDQMNDRTAAMYLALADSWSKKGQDVEAASCLKKVMALCPNTRHADLAQSELTRLQSKTNPAVPAGLVRP